MLTQEFTDIWNGCYDEGWKGLIVDEAFSHPAKMSYSLAARIYEHAFKSGWLKPGDTVVDPFGGICGTAIHAACHGVKWIGCELEQRFYELGYQNIDLWQRLYGNYSEWVRPTLYCGDSRRLAEIIGMATACVGSPPYSGSLSQGNNQSEYDYTKYGGGGQLAHGQTYGDSPGQLGRLAEGDIAAVLSSPPFCDGGMGDSRPFGGIANKKPHWNETTGPGGLTEYGQTAGQLGAMVVGSPPFEGSLSGVGECPAVRPDGSAFGQGRSIDLASYGETSGNIGNASGETFWQAARDIVIQCHAILRPGGVAIWVTKDFVRAKKRVPFSDQWLALCESVGFKLVCRHRASLVKRGETQKLLDGGEHTHTTSRKSFFRRLAERKGSPAIDWEDVICVQKVESRQ